MLTILLTQDYFFWSKVDGTAKAAQLSAALAKSLAETLVLLEANTAAQVMIDLRHPDSLAVIHLCAEREIKTIGFVSHADTDTIAAARAAGCTMVMPKSQFSMKLSELLK